MKRRLLVGMAAILVVAAGTIWAATDTNAPPMGSTDYMDWKNGFRDVRFGEEFTNRGDIAVVSSNYPDEFRKLHEDLKIGSATVRDITYFTFHGKATGIVISCDLENGPKLLDVFTAAYGEPVADDEDSSKQHWRGNQVRASYSLNKESDVYFLVVQNREWSRKRADENDAKAKAAAEKSGL